MSESCPICDYESSSTVGVKQHLSQSHEDKNNPYKSRTNCKNCGCDFWILDSYLEMGKGTFCSESCNNEFGRVETVCKNCEENFIIDKNEYNRRESNGKFCSRECKSDYKSIDRNCEICGKEFHIKKALDERGGGKYCSQECYYKSEISENTGIRNTAEYKRWKKEVKKRDGCCVDCGEEENLHSHHIIPVEEDASLVTDLDNGETLCTECHASRHPEIAHLITETFNTDTTQ